MKIYQIIYYIGNKYMQVTVTANNEVEALEIAKNCVPKEAKNIRLMVT